MRTSERDLLLMFDRADLARKMAPIAVVTALASLSLLFGEQERSMLMAGAALVLWTVVIAATFLLPWAVLPRAFQLIVPLGYLAGVVLLREAEGGPGAGLATLVLVPVIMIALYGRRSDLLICIVGAALALAIPIILIGDPNYPPTEWRRLIITTAVATLVGFTVQGLVRSIWHQSRVDVLTGVANRRVLEEQLVAEVARARRKGMPLVVAYLDVDHFKVYNDNNGHLAGDRFLAEAAYAWQAQLRASDLLARIGGEEFVAVLPDCDLDQALVVAERLRASTPAGHTSSVGLARWDGQESADELLARADQALYRAKEGGRDQAIVAESSAPKMTAALEAF